MLVVRFLDFVKIGKYPNKLLILKYFQRNVHTYVGAFLKGNYQQQPGKGGEVKLNVTLGKIIYSYANYRYTQS